MIRNATATAAMIGRRAVIEPVFVRGACAISAVGFASMQSI